ncbi:hypothetical protein AZE42_07252 [Rhizopogon vesiculosus]|uniref:Uncharacterized protein n=1 Tax=Rhizopogon vesiculosus TaxID=180088 RepID=A0A1J8Q3U7_9AGAM|nr:hypothetical protein AZE42_07252 [Rhizopogon vesiculosus]
MAELEATRTIVPSTTIVHAFELEGRWNFWWLRPSPSLVHASLQHIETSTSQSRRHSGILGTTATVTATLPAQAGDKITDTQSRRKP